MKGHHHTIIHSWYCAHHMANFPLVCDFLCLFLSFPFFYLCLVTSPNTIASWNGKDHVNIVFSAVLNNSRWAIPSSRKRKAHVSVTFHTKLVQIHVDHPFRRKYRHRMRNSLHTHTQKPQKTHTHHLNRSTEADT